LGISPSISCLPAHLLLLLLLLLLLCGHAGSGLASMGDAHVLVQLDMDAIGQLQVCLWARSVSISLEPGGEQQLGASATLLADLTVCGSHTFVNPEPAP
jgi:hypothetical protein